MTATPDGYPPPLNEAEVIRLNESIARFAHRQVLPALGPGGVLDERNWMVDYHRSGQPDMLAALDRLLRYRSKPDDDGSSPGGLPSWTPQMFAQQIATRFAGEPFYVTDEMARIADYAAASIREPVTFTPDLLPTPVGYIRLEQPRYSVERAGRRVGTTAYGWAPARCDLRQPGRPPRQVPGTYVMQFTHRDDALDEINQQIGRRISPVLCWEHAWIIPYSEIPYRPVHVADPPAFLWALFHLMQQEVGTTVRQAGDRASRRRCERLRLPESVSVVRLRRARHVGDSPAEDGGRDWTCRWIVRGHWRHLTRTRPDGTSYADAVWIAPYMKNRDRVDLPVRDPERRLTVLSR